MSCFLKELANIQDLHKVMEWLFQLQTNVYDDDEDASRKYDNWLEECITAFSPTLDILALAHENRLAILKSQYERASNGDKMYSFLLAWKGKLSHWQMGDEITSLICLPLISQKQSSSGAPDWTTIIVGFKSGYISFLTESGVLLLSQIFHENIVKNLSVRTYVAKNFGTSIYSDLSEELIILYPKCVVSIDGFGLMQMLKACRNQAAKASALGEELHRTTFLSYKKWSLSEQEEVNTCVSTGMVAPHLYDHIMLMSNTLGFNQTITGSVPTTSLLICAGRGPYLASYSIKEGATVPFITDIASHYASKFKNAFLSAASGFIFGSKPEESNKKERTKIEQAISIPFRYSLIDRRRVGTSLQLSLSRRLLSVTDDFGRVSIVDVQKFLVVRMLKGYRDAECGWLNVSGDFEGARREVPFLVVHAPRRSLLEVWLPQQGSRVAAFNVPKKSKLIYVPHSMLGSNTQQTSSFNCVHNFLINSQGTVQQIVVPFHLALSSKTGKQAKDVHLLQTFKSALRDKPIQEIAAILREIKTSHVKTQVIEVLCSSKYATTELATEIVREFTPGDSNVPCEDGEFIVDGDYENHVLAQQLGKLGQLLHFFQTLVSIHFQDSFTENNESLENILFRSLNVSCSEKDLLLNIIKESSLQNMKFKKVCFTEDVSFGDFLQFFDLTHKVVVKEKEDFYPVHLKRDVTKDTQLRICHFLFAWPFSVNSAEKFGLSFAKSGLNPFDVLSLSLNYWNCAVRQIDYGTTLNFFHILLILVVLSENNIMTTEISGLRPLWAKVREDLSTWNWPFNAYVTAFLCRSVETSLLLFVCEQLKKEKTDKEICDNNQLLPVEHLDTLSTLNALLLVLTQRACSTTAVATSGEKLEVSTEAQEAWEDLSFEIVEWNLILKRLEKLVHVQRLHEATVVLMDNVRNVCEATSDCSIKTLLNKGKGYLSELIAQWLIESNLSTDKLIWLIRKDELCSFEDLSSSTTAFPEEQLSHLRALFEGVRTHFPNSAQPDVLLVNVAWELASLWKKFPNNVDLFCEAVNVLNYIEECYLKQGVSCMMWDTWVVHFVRSSTQLMDKTFCRPKEKLCLRKIGIANYFLDRFFTCAKDLLEHILTSSAACDLDLPALFDKDDFWKDVDSVPSLAEVTLFHTNISCDLAFLHQQLLSVLILIVRYDLKGVVPTSLFPERDRSSLFKPLKCSWRISSSDDSREAVNNCQLTFLNKAISGAVASLPDAHSVSHIETPAGLFDAIEIGRSWGVSLDVLRRHYVCELYSSGHDVMATQALIMVRDGLMIGSQMLVIAGQRLNYLVTCSPNNHEIAALMTPTMKEWCSSLHHWSLRCPNMPVKDTLKMVNKAILFIPHSDNEHKVAANLIRTLNMINDAGL